MPPEASDDFEWVASTWGHLLRARSLSHVPHGWTTRELGLKGRGESEHAAWGAVARTAGLSPAALVRLRQVHGAQIHISAASLPSAPPEADIVLTSRDDRVLAVQVADCAPILAASSDGLVVSAAHAGWRGTAANVAGVTIESLSRHFDVAPASVSVAIGPSIGPCCYEVGGELIDAFAANGWTGDDRARWFARRGDKLFLDIWQANVDQLVRAGVAPARVRVSRLCTACHGEWFYSYRREGAGTGRMAGFIRPRLRPV